MTPQTTPEAELRACPFCGSDEIMLSCDPAEGLDNCGPSRALQCAGCHIEAPFYGTEAEAIAAWNRRALQATAEPRGGKLLGASQEDEACITEVRRILASSPPLLNQELSPCTSVTETASCPAGVATSAVEALRVALEPLARNGGFYRPELQHFESVPIPLDFLRAAKTTYEQVFGPIPSSQTPTPDDGLGPRSETLHSPPSPQGAPTCFECGQDLHGPYCPACNPNQGARVQALEDETIRSLLRCTDVAAFRARLSRALSALSEVEGEKDTRGSDSEPPRKGCGPAGDGVKLENDQ